MEELQSIIEGEIVRIKESGEVFIKEVSGDFVNFFVKTLKLPATMSAPITELLSLKKPTSVIWLSLSECTGCTESLLRNEVPGIDSLLLEFISLDYHDVLMADFGYGAREKLQKALKGEYILVVEGSVCVEEEFFATFGAEGMSGKEELKHIAEHALMVFGVGTCASFGGVQAAAPNPTRTESIERLINREVVNIPGCPPSDINIVVTLMYAMLFKRAPELDALHRPLWAYGKSVHDSCERKAKFESGDFVQSFDDENMKAGYCLYKVGCKGPYAYNNCPKVKFNSKTSWPIAAGHGCIACSEPNFWDDFGVYEEPMKKQFAYFAKSPKWEAVAETTQDLEVFARELGEESIGVFLDTSGTQILYKGQNILETSLECNPRVFLENLAKKSKLTGRLVENYKNYFGALYDKNMQAGEDSKPSSNLADVFALTHALLSTDEESEPALRVINEAKDFAFSQISDMDFSAKVEGERIFIDTTKGMRLPLCYVLGGLEYDGIAYGVVASVCKSLKEGIKKFAQDKSIAQVHLGGNLTQNPLVQTWLAG